MRGRWLVLVASVALLTTASGVAIAEHESLCRSTRDVRHLSNRGDRLDDRDDGRIERNCWDGRGRPDRLALRGRADDAWGGDGGDHLWGGGGADRLFGELDNDSLYGEAGADRLYGDIGYDALFGGSDDDELYGGPLYDELYGGDGNDRLFGDDGTDVLWGGAGDDELTGGADQDQVYGESGADTLFASSDANRSDHLYGGPDGDTFWSLMSVNVSMNGDEGDDIFYDGPYRNIAIGGEGTDTFYDCPTELGEWQETISVENHLIDEAYCFYD